MSDETLEEQTLEEQLIDGAVFDGSEAGPSLAGVEFALVMLNLPVTHVDFPAWAAKKAPKAQRANYLVSIQLQAREEGDELWTYLGHFGSAGDGINYDWFNRGQVRELMPWLETISEALGFCAPLPGFKCHRDAPPLP